MPLCHKEALGGRASYKVLKLTDIRFKSVALTYLGCHKAFPSSSSAFVPSITVFFKEMFADKQMVGAAARGLSIKHEFSSQHMMRSTL